MEKENSPTEITQAMYNIRNAVAGGSIAILNEVQDVKKELSKLYSKPRKEIETSGLMTAMDQKIYVQHFYSDGSTICEPCVLNISGPWIIKQLTIDGRRSPLRMIVFENGGNPVELVFDSKKIKPRRLYELLLKKGFWFNTNIRTVKVSEILYATFAADMEGKESFVDVASLAGWHEKTYENRNTFFFLDVPELAEYPVATTTLTEGVLGKDIVIHYAEYIGKISDEDDRVLIALYPFLSSLSSIFAKTGYREKLVLNLILDDNASLSEVVEMLKITNRGTEGIVDATLPKKQLEKKAACIKDDVFVVDGILRNITASDKKKIKANIARLLEDITGERACSYLEIQKGCTIISDYLMFGSNVCNVAWNIHKTPKRMDKYSQDAMGVVFSEFIKYVEDCYDQVEEWINCHRSKNEQKIAMFEVTYKIFIEFFKVKGFSGMAILGIDKHPDFAKLVAGHQLDVEGLENYFVKIIRKAALKFKFASLETSHVMEQTVRYSKEFLWIPSSLMRSVLRENSLEKHMIVILTHLRDKSILEIKGEGLTVRFRGTEWYKLRRDFFNKPGLADIVDLGEVLA